MFWEAVVGPLGQSGSPACPVGAYCDDGDDLEQDDAANGGEEA